MFCRKLSCVRLLCKNCKICGKDFHFRKLIFLFKQLSFFGSHKLRSLFTKKSCVARYKCNFVSFEPKLLYAEVASATKTRAPARREKKAGCVRRYAGLVLRYAGTPVRRYAGPQEGAQDGFFTGSDRCASLSLHEGS